MSPERLICLLEMAGYAVERYSGRFMYGKHCPAIFVDKNEVAMVGAKLAYTLGQEANGNILQMQSDYDDLIALLDGTATDELGKDQMVVYWPSVRED